jgi:ERCC4-type nuclease
MTESTRHPIQVIVDDREMRGRVPVLLQSDSRFSVTIERLKVGDYEVGGRLLFERKTLPDLVQSIIDGRLFRQALRLRKVEGKRVALILEGTTGDLNRSGMTWEAVQGALVTVALQVGLPILRTRSPEETVKTLAFAAAQARMIASDNLPRAGCRPKGKRALQSYILQGLPGVGPERAARLLQHFGSVRATVAASPEELLEIDGIGCRTVRRIEWAVKESRRTMMSYLHG